MYKAAHCNRGWRCCPAATGSSSSSQEAARQQTSRRAHRTSAAELAYSGTGMPQSCVTQPQAACHPHASSISHTAHSCMLCNLRAAMSPKRSHLYMELCTAKCQQDITASASLAIGQQQASQQTRVTRLLHLHPGWTERWQWPPRLKLPAPRTQVRWPQQAGTGHGQIKWQLPRACSTCMWLDRRRPL